MAKDRLGFVPEEAIKRLVPEPERAQSVVVWQAVQNMAGGQTIELPYVPPSLLRLVPGDPKKRSLFGMMVQATLASDFAPGSNPGARQPAGTGGPKAEGKSADTERGRKFRNLGARRNPTGSRGGDLTSGVDVIIQPEGDVSLPTGETGTPPVKEPNPNAKHPVLSKDKVAILIDHRKTPGQGLNDLLFDTSFVTPEERVTPLWQDVISRSKTIDDVLINCNRSLLWDRVRRYSWLTASAGIEQEDLFAIAEKAMREAIPRFDPSHEEKGETASFATYGLNNVEFQLQIGIQKIQNIGSGEYKFINGAGRIKYAFLRAIGREAEESDMREQLLYHAEMTESMTERVLGFFMKHSLVSLDMPIGENSSDNELIDSLPSISDSQVTDLDETRMQRGRIRVALSVLSQIEQSIMLDKLGWNETHRDLTDRELAEKYSLTPVQIRSLVTGIYIQLGQEAVLGPVAKGRKGEAPSSDFDAEAYRNAVLGADLSTRERTLALSEYIPAIEIAALCGIHPNGVYKIQRQMLAAKDITHTVPPPSKKANTERIIELHIKGFEGHEIAEDVGMPASTVYTAIHDLIEEGRIRSWKTARMERIAQGPPPSDNVPLVGMWLEKHTHYETVWRQAYFERLAA